MKTKKIISLILAVTVVLSIGTVSTLAYETSMHETSIINTLNLSDYAAEQISILSKDSDYLTIQPIELSEIDSRRSAEIVEAFQVVATKQVSDYVDNLTGETVKQMKDEVVILTNSFSEDGSDGKYDVAYLTTIYYSLQGQLGNMQVSLDTVSGRVFDAGTNSIYCTKLEFRGYIAEPLAPVDVYTSPIKTVNKPVNNMAYYQYMESGWHPAHFSVITAYELSFSNGTKLEGHYVLQYK